MLGDLVFVDPPEVGETLQAGADCAVVESVKAASDVYSPVTGEVVAINDALQDAPETINEDAFGDGWLFQVRLADPSELDGLLDADSYAAMVEEED
jgi:glycine cleavage system H protein